MCAICGVVNFDGAPVDEGALVKMRDEMLNRGPERGGLHIEGNVGLGHRRLRIIDLSEAGAQPMSNADGSVRVTFNGEIYNFMELRPLLEAKGHQFKSRSDTEVIVHGYAEWGEAVIEKLDGMFAIGIWDAKKKQLLLARDRFGKKPLYYVQQGKRLAFASELKAIATLPGLSLTINPDAIDCYLHHLGVTQQQSIYKEVKKVQPGHYEVFSEGSHREERYFRPDYTHKIVASEPELLERIDAALRAAVKKRLVADVPLGAFLSGGVDSSMIVAMSAQLSSAPVKTFSIGFEEQEFSELGYARQVAERYGTQHEEISLRPDVLEILPALLYEYGEPFADSSAVPTYYVSVGARRFVTVALSGDGGDEMFGGYDNARSSYWAQQYDNAMPGLVRGPMEGLLAGYTGGDPGGVVRKLRTLVNQAADDPAQRHSGSMAFSSANRERLYTDAFKSSIKGSPALEVFTRHADELRGLSLVDQTLLLTAYTRLPNDYLVKVDVASMKVALELRSPFLDTALATLAASIDPMVKVSRGRQKYLLKKLAERYLPHDVIYRPKRGFSLPLKHWLRKELAPAIKRFLPDGKAVQLGWFRGDYVNELIAQHNAGSHDHTHRLWALLCLEIWYRMFVDKTMSPTDTLRS